MTLALVCAGLIAWTPIGDPPPSPDLARAYQEAKAQAGRSPDAQVRLALWCEANGLTAQRLHHLTLAILADPKNAAARGLMGLVSRDGRWLRPEAVAEKARADASLAEYEAKRLKAAYTADAQHALGLWCDERGLKEQAKAHLTAVIRLDPSREAAWKKLGYRKHEGRWATDAQIAAEKADAEAQKQADRKWKPLLERYKAMLDLPARREEAEAALANVTDPRAVPMIGKVFATVEATQPRAVQLLGQVDTPSASKALAYLAVFAKSAEARRAAAETLRGRDAREYADLLIALIRDPIKYEVKSVGGPGSPGVLFIEGKKVNLRRLYSPQSPHFIPGDRMEYDPQIGPVVIRNLGVHTTGMANPVLGTALDPSTVQRPTAAVRDRLDAVLTRSGFGANSQRIGNLLAQAVVNQPLGQEEAVIRLSATQLPLNPSTRFSFTYRDQAEIPLARFEEEAQKSVAGAQQQLAGDIAVLEGINRDSALSNARVVGVLRAATGVNLAESRDAWKEWWVDQLGYRYNQMTAEARPTVIESVTPNYVPQLIPVAVTTQLVGFGRISCFGAGTPVRTIDGVRPIESLKVGDLVLTQGTDSGSLGYKPILVVHHNPPSATFRIKLGGESIVSSHFHRFWVAGRGWVMARELKPGDPVRTLGGVEPVQAVEPDKVQLVYNLDVAEDADFFAGDVAALVHDNTLPDPRLVPFDAAPGPEAVATARRAD